MRLRRHFKFEETTGIDLAPMLDFVLNLLIFFIITAVFAKELSFAMNRPGAQSATGGRESSNIVINIQEDGEVWVDKRIVDVRSVRANVERLHALKPDWGVMIVAHENAETGVLIGVADQVRLGGVSNITFGTTQ
jgi:biopolymer transport protein ExbD